MKTHFHIENEYFDQYFKLTLDGKEYYFSDHLTVEHDHSDSLTFDLEIVHAQDYFKRNMLTQKSKLSIYGSKLCSSVCLHSLSCML